MIVRVVSVAVCLVSALPHFLQAAQSPKRDVVVVMGRVTNAQGDPLSEVSVSLAPVSLDLGKPSAQTKTDTLGEYRLKQIEPGSYTIRFQAKGFRSRIYQAVPLGADETTRLDVVLELAPEGKTLPSDASEGHIMDFSDAPNFTVAGITDRSNMGLHGSDAKVRTSDVLTKETAALKSGSGGSSASSSGAGDVHRIAGDAKEKSGDPLGAEKEYEAAVKLDPSEENYFAWGAELLLHHAGPATVQVFAKSVALHPQSERLRAGLSAAYYADGQYTEAADQMCKASDLAPSDPQPYLFLGKMEKAAADPLPCSDEKLARFIHEQPRNALANFYYGLVLWKTSRKTQDPAGFAAAENYLQKAVELDPSLGEAYLQLGTLYNSRGRKDAALAAFQQAVAASPELTAAHYQLSLAFRRAGDAAKADQELKIYDELRRSEDAQLERERRELRQFVTILKDYTSSAPH